MNVVLLGTLCAFARDTLSLTLSRSREREGVRARKDASERKIRNPNFESDFGFRDSNLPVLNRGVTFDVAQDMLCAFAGVTVFLRSLMKLSYFFGGA